MSETVTKAEYARRRGVTQGAVTTWLKRRHLTPPALLDDGRLDVELADAQLRDRLDHARRVDHPPVGDGAPVPAAAALIEQQRLQKIAENDLRLRRLQRAELEHAGSLVSLAGITKVHNRLTEELLREIEVWLPDLAVKLGAGHQGVAVARREWRAFRDRQAAGAKDRAAGLPDLVPVE